MTYLFRVTPLLPFSPSPLLNMRRGGTGLAISILLIGSLWGCQRGGASGKPAAIGKAASVSSLPIMVSVTPARVGRIQQVAYVTGVLTSQDDVVVGVKAAGRLVAVYKREGDPVRAGEVVAQQDTADAQALLDQQRANLASARTKLDQAKVAYQNAQTTLKLTDEQTRSAVKDAQAALDAAKQQEQIMAQGARTQERQQAQEDVAAAKADRDVARADLKRYRDLFQQNAVSAQQLDQAQATADSADARYNRAVQALSLIQAGNRPEDIRRAQAAVEQATQAVVTAQANRNQVALRRDDVQTALQGIASAQAGVAQSEAAVRLAQQALRDTTVVSPIDGVVAERRAEPGQQLGAGKDVLRIVSLKSIYYDAQLPEAQFEQVQIGQPVAVTIDAIGGRTFHGFVYKLFPVASSGARSFTVRIRLQNEGNLLRPAMFARGQIVLAAHLRAVLVPRVAVLDQTQTSGRLFVVQKGVAEERKVQIGFSNPADVEITSGVQQGEKVVTVGQAQLQNGAAVEVQ